MHKLRPSSASALAGRHCLMVPSIWKEPPIVKKVGQGTKSLVRTAKDEILWWVWVKPNALRRSVLPEASEPPEGL